MGLKEYIKVHRNQIIMCMLLIGVFVLVSCSSPSPSNAPIGGGCG